MQSIGVTAQTILLLSASNCFMLTAWYLHLKYLSEKPWYLAVLASWAIAFLEYNFHIPANRIGHAQFDLSQLQILQVGMSLLLFVPFSLVVMGTPVKLDYIWASLCLLGAAYFLFRGMT